MTKSKGKELLVLTQAEVKEFLHYDPLTGFFTWIKSSNWSIKVGSRAQSLTPNKYIAIGINKKQHLAHRLAWLYMTGEMPKEFIDHINGDRSDNRFCNLREATRQQNNQNQKKRHKNSTTGFLGVTKGKQKGFVAKIRSRGKDVYIGSFHTAEEASRAYLEAKRKLHEFCTI